MRMTTFSDTLRIETWAVTGAAGRIGRALRPRLRARVGHLVCIDDAVIDDADPSETVRTADLRDPDAVRLSLDGCHGVIHLGGLPYEAGWAELSAVNVGGTANVLEAARRNGIRRVVYASSNHATGFHPVSTPVDARTPARPDSLYGASKVAAEALCSLYSDKFGVSTIRLRIGAFDTDPVDAGGMSAWLSVDDAERAVVAAMTTEVTSSTVYVCSRNRTRWWSLVDGAAIGFEPQDDSATRFPGVPVAAGSAGPQGRDFAEASLTADVLER